MPETQQHYYPLERRAGEIERLHAQGDALIADTAIMLDHIGVAPGWRCLDLGCGPRGITDLLSVRVGPVGRVVGLDADAVFLDHARQHVNSRGFTNVEFVPGDVFRIGWERLKGAFTEVFPHIAGKPWSPHVLYRTFRQSGLEDVQYRPFLVGFRSSDPMADYLPATMESLRSTLLEKRLIDDNELDAAIAACRAHLADPGTVSTFHTVVQVWGKRRAT